MLERSVKAPVGCNLRSLIAKAAMQKVDGSQITVVVPTNHIIEVWRDLLPDAAIINVFQWLNSPRTYRQLIVVDELYPAMFDRVRPSLHAASQPVWLVNMPLTSPTA